MWPGYREVRSDDDKFPAGQSVSTPNHKTRPAGDAAPPRSSKTVQVWTPFPASRGRQSASACPHKLQQPLARAGTSTPSERNLATHCRRRTAPPRTWPVLSGPASTRDDARLDGDQCGGTGLGTPSGSVPRARLPARRRRAPAPTSANVRSCSRSFGSSVPMGLFECADNASPQELGIRQGLSCLAPRRRPTGSFQRVSCQCTPVARTR